MKPDSPLGMRPLRPEERERAFQGVTNASSTEYVEAIREMEGGVAYALPLDGCTARALRVRMSRAAKKLHLQLRWAKTLPDAKELIVELKP